MFRFEVVSSVGSMRRGRLYTPHGVVDTPAFMPVATQAAIKAADLRSAKQMGMQIVLVNAYHLYLRPGTDVIAHAGGLHKFMNWNGPMLADSGGFQIMSLASLVKIDDDGVTFRSHIDGSEHRLTPERVVEIQEALGPDFAMPLDQCISYPHDEQQAIDALDRTRRWLERSLSARRRKDQAMFGIVQGGTFPHLRRQAADHVVDLDADGIAVGGMCVGECRNTTLAMLEQVVQRLPREKPRYVMGAGSPELLIDACVRGYDMFDCVLPTRLARHGSVLTEKGQVTIKNAEHARDMGPIDEDCDCPVCGSYSRAYIRHLFKAGEILGMQLATVHNIRYIQRLMETIRNVRSVTELSDLQTKIHYYYQQGSGW